MDTKNLKKPTADQLTYTSYLKVHDLISLQNLITNEHDEMLFIVIHQVYELWFKQILHETLGMIEFIKKDEDLAFLKALRRVNRIQDLLNSQIDILETMTPNDFDVFRSRLNPASGFQSHQFRLLEFMLGLKDLRYLQYHKNDARITELLQNALNAPTVYDHVLAFLARKNIQIPQEVLSRNFSEPHKPNDELARQIARIYKNPKKDYDLYLVLEALLDWDEKLSLWRFRHIQMVERIIGITRGTGGSSGVEYLATTLQKRCFPEIWNARQYIITHLKY